MQELTKCWLNELAAPGSYKTPPVACVFYPRFFLAEILRFESELVADAVAKLEQQVRGRSVKGVPFSDELASRRKIV